ncbi:MAG: S-layer homology domain-containing protein, partial [Phormidesmis sp.]
LDESFRPDSSLTRTEFAAMMLKAFPDAAKVKDTPNFSDVAQDFWGYRAIAAAYERGFLAGYPDNTFKPAQAVTRAQAITVVASAHRLQSPDSSQAINEQYFDDAGEIPDYARGVIAAATQRSLVVSYPVVTRLRPNANASRGEVAAFLCRLDATGLDARYYVPAEYVAGFGEGNNNAAFTAPTLLKEFPIPSVSGLLYSNIVFNQKVFFSANDGIHGEELWVTDGTRSGTQLVHDLAPGSDENGRPQSSVPHIFGFSDRQFWINTIQGYEQSTLARSLWRSDGTDEGTQAIATLHPLLPGLFNRAESVIPFIQDPQPNFLASLPFVVEADMESENARSQLWLTDGGSEAGTQQLANFPLTGVGRRYSQGFAIAGDYLFFTMKKDTDELTFPAWELWRSDGTSAGTLNLETPSVDQNTLTAWGNHIYMRVDSPDDGAQWWTSDGSLAGTGLLNDIYPGPKNSPPYLMTGLGTSFFTLAQSPEGFELWATEGTPESTRLIKQLSSGPAYSSPQDTRFIVHQNRLFFSVPIVRQTPRASGEPLSTSAFELWVTDGTQQGTQRLKNFQNEIESFTAFKGQLFFNGGGPNGKELWVTDGTQQGTRQLLDLSPAGGTLCSEPLPTEPGPECARGTFPENTSPRAITAHGDFLYFIADNRHLYRTDGTGQGMQYIQRVKGDNYRCCSPQIVSLGDSLLFSGYVSEDNRPQLWVLPTENR